MAPAPKKDSGVTEITLNWHCGKPASLRGSPRRPLVQSLFISYWDALPSIPANASAVMSSQEAEEPEATGTASLPRGPTQPALPLPLPLPSQDNLPLFPLIQPPDGTSSHSPQQFHWQHGQGIHLGKDSGLVP